MTATIAERKAKKLERMMTQSQRAIDELRNFARRHEGRFVVFGSTARTALRYNSDFDVLIDFAEPTDRHAYFFAEATCLSLGLRPDIHYLAEASDALLSRIKADALVLS